MTQVRFSNQVDDRKLRFAVIVTNAGGHCTGIVISWEEAR